MKERRKAEREGKRGGGEKKGKGKWERVVFLLGGREYKERWVARKRREGGRRGRGEDGRGRVVLFFGRRERAWKKEGREENRKRKGRQGKWGGTGWGGAMGKRSGGKKGIGAAGKRKEEGRGRVVFFLVGGEEKGGGEVGKIIEEGREEKGNGAGQGRAERKRIGAAGKRKEEGRGRVVFFLAGGKENGKWMAGKRIEKGREEKRSRAG